MKPRAMIAFVLLLAAMLLLARQSFAVTLRYAVVVGNNESEGSPLPALAHAEAEARSLADALQRFAGFPPERIVLLAGPTRASLLRAAAQVAQWRAADVARIPDANTLFTFAYTGHGLRGQLLLADGPLSQDELGAVFRDVGADFSLGVFDACYAGSLTGGLEGKGGIVTTPGINLFEQLPTDVLMAEGRMWFVSSGPDELSFEDSRIGGVFTHYFIEALSRAPRDGPGISLDRIWSYSRNHTVKHTEERGQAQKPRMTARVEGEAFPTFSFPVARSARLEFHPDVAGDFVLSYADGAVSQLITKPRGETLGVAVFPGSARLVHVDEGTVLVSQPLELAEGTTLIGPGDTELAPAGLGRRAHTLFRKGGVDSVSLDATTVQPYTSVGLGAAYSFSPRPAAELAPEHSAQIVLRLDWLDLIGALSVGYGHAAQRFDSWGFRLDALTTDLDVGYGWDLGPVRVGLMGRIGADLLMQGYDDGQSRTSWAISTGALATVVVPTTAIVHATVSVGGGVRITPGVGVDQRHRAAGWFQLVAGVLFNVR